MDIARIDYLIEELQKADVQFVPGLSDDEVIGVETRFDFRFPPDLRALLQRAMPISGSRKRGFPDWRDGLVQNILGRLNWPAEGISIDIEHNDFWKGSWGTKPDDLQKAFHIARAAIADAPRLIPIFGHRYIPSEPHEEGNPVFSVWQTDIIYYGYDLASYFAHEFRIPCPEWAANRPRPIVFWGWI